MKKTLLSVIIVMAGVTVQAQPEAGKIFIGGAFEINTSGNKFKDGGTVTDEYSFTNIRILPMAGYFLSDNLAVGLSTGISSNISKFPDDDPDKRSTTMFVLQPFGRYYFTSGTGGIFAEARVGFTAGKSKYFYETNTIETNLTAFSIGIGPGVYYYITPSIALEAEFGLIGFTTNIEKDGDQKSVQNDMDFGLFPSGIGFGITFTL